jgi:hypothetical protein
MCDNNIDIQKQQDEIEELNNILGIKAIKFYDFLMDKVVRKDKRFKSFIYFFTLGTVKELRVSMNIDTKYNDDYIVGKFGYTKDLARRIYEHIKELKHIENCELKIKCFAHIDPIYLSNAKEDIKKCIKIFNGTFIYENKYDFVIVKKNLISHIEVQYNLVGIKYEIYVSEHTKKLKEIEYNNKKEMVKLNHEIYVSEHTKKLKEMELNHEKEMEKLNHEKEMIKLNHEKKMQKLENTLLQKKLENTKLKKS